MMYFAMQAAPAGWLKANGAVVSRTQYAALFAAIGTTYGAGDGRTTFNLPDLRGEFVRGWDGGRAIDPGRAFGAAQADEIKTHKHRYRRGHIPNTADWETFEWRRGNGTVYDGDGRFDDTGDVVYTDTVGGAETRPRNIVLLACIKI